ncbi:MAG: glycosyltransferase [Acidobacteria bacterium]|nr:MAG: glycosyltransferase [Acidobacteriota bacterium]
MRIVFFGPASSWHVTRWARRFVAQGHDVTLASMHAIPDEVRALAVPLADAPGEGATSPRTLLAAIRRGRRLVAQVRPDLVLAYYMSSYGLVAALSGGRPLVGAAAGGDVLVDPFDGLARRAVNRAAVGLALARCDGMLCWAPHVAERLEQLGVARDRILVQPRGVDLGRFRYRPPSADDARPLRVFSIRLFKPLYRVETLAEALVELAGRGVPIEARLAGWGPERERIETILRRGGVTDRVRLLGRVAPDDVPQAMSWADVYVSTSSTDGASAALFEALAVGLFPVVSDIPANRAFLEEGRTARFFPVGDARRLAAILGELAADRRLVVEGVESARPLVRDRLDFEANMRRIGAWLEALVERHRAGAAAQVSADRAAGDKAPRGR